MFWNSLLLLDQDGLELTIMLCQWLPSACHSNSQLPLDLWDKTSLCSSARPIPGNNSSSFPSPTAPQETSIPCVTLQRTHLSVVSSTAVLQESCLQHAQVFLPLLILNWITHSCADRQTARYISQFGDINQAPGCPPGFLRQLWHFTFLLFFWFFKTVSL